MVKKIDASSIEVNEKKISFRNEKIRKLNVFEDISIIVFECGYPDMDKYYNNVIAIDNKTGYLIWEVEKDEKIDKQNPYMSVFDNTIFLIMQKSNDIRIPINRNTGKIIRNIDLNKGHRPW